MKKVFVKFLLCFGMVLCFFTSCEIGLGAQVDVEPPSVVMESPTENARTRKTVTFSGTWTDDLEIKQVTVELKKTTELTDVKESFSFIANTTNNGDDKTKGTWSYCLDTEAANIPDGAYTVIAIAEDTYGHTNQVSTVITIDNTPPLIVLESPSTTEISSPMSYGKTFSIIGRGADEQNGGTVDSIDAVIYDENNVEIARKTFTNISTSIDFKIADWDEESEQDNNFYKTIYGTDENAGTKNYYVELIAYDDARKVPAEEGDRGNSTNIIYLNNTLSLIDGYKPSVAYNILNRSASSDSESALEKALKDKANQINKLTFSLNPVNNPYFEVQGYESLGTTANLEDERYSFLNKNKLTVNVYVGRDNKQIRPETVGIYLEPCDVNGNVTGSSKVTLLEPGAISSSGAITDKAVYTEEFKYSSASCTWTSKSLDVETIDGLEIGKYYKVNVSAQDYNGVNIRNSNQYAVKITTVNSAPIIIINEPGASLTIAKSAAYTVKGVVKTSSKITKIRLYKNEFVEAKDPTKEYVVNASETINDSGVADLKDKIVLNTSQTTVSQRYYNFSFEVKGISDPYYTLVVVAFDDNNQYAQKEISIENDVNEPTFDDSPTITPLVSSSINEDTGGGIYTVNGTINIAELISDDKKVGGSWWSASDTMPDATKDEGWNAGNLDGSSATNLKFSIDTTQFTDKSKKIIHLKAKDASGNIATDSSVITLDVDQSTDAPVVELSNTNANTNTNQAAKDYPELDYNNEWDEKAYLAAKQSPNRTVFGTKSNNEMLGTISDDDGIESVEVYYQKIELETTENGENKLSLKDKNPITLDTIPNKKTTYSLKAKMPSDQGTYLITINVKDSKQENTGYNSTTIGPFLVAVDDGAPKLKIETASGGFKTSKFSVSGTIDDPYATLKRYTDEACSQNEKTITINSNCTWVDEIEVDTENNIYTYYYKAEDDYNQSSIESFSFKYDKKAPVFMVDSVNGDKIESTNSQTQTELLKYGTIDGTYFMITGLVSDFFYTTDSELSKENVLYEYDNKDNNETDKENYYNKYLKQNENTASGFSESDFYYYVGKTEPVKTEADTSYDITKDGWSTCKISPLDPAGYIGKWTVSINFKELGCENSDIRYIYFAAKDSAGNVSIIDNKIPVIKIVIDSESPKITGSTITVLEKPVIKVSATDNIKINTGKLSVYNNNALMTASDGKQTGEYKYTTTSSTDDESKKTTVTFEITLTSVPVGKNKYKVEVVDEAGNKATGDDITIENKAPVISGTKTGIPDNAYKVEQDGNQYSYITKAIASSATVKCTEDNNKLKDVTWKDTYIKTEKYENGTQTNTIEILNSGTCSPDSAGIITIAEISEESFKKYENAYVTRTVTATNIYGQTSEWNFYYILDSIKPNLLAKSEGNVDITTLGGTNVNSLGTVWFNKDTLEIKGSYFEEGSGIKQIEYELTDGIDNSTVQTGMIYTSSPVDKKESFSSIISGFTESSTQKAFNVIKLTATDKAGNVSASQSYNIQIDTTVPKLIETTAPGSSESTTSNIWYRFAGDSNWKQYNNSILTNKAKAIELTGYFADANTGYVQSGVKEIKVEVNGKTYQAKVCTENGGVWSVPAESTGFEKNVENGASIATGYWFATIDTKALGSNGTVNAKITVTDNAGNSDSTNTVNFLVDTVPPTVTVEMPTANTTLNGLNTFSGKVNDANDVKSIALYYAKGTACPTSLRGFTEMKHSYDTEMNLSYDTDNGASMSDVSAWKFTNYDVNNLLDTEEESEVYILPVAYDKAGNCSIDTLSVKESDCIKIKIDLNSDRPVIKFNNLIVSGKDVYVTSDSLNISVDDDDGISKLEYSFDGGTTWTEATVSSGSATISLVEDGKKKVYFKIKDSAGATFTTADAKTYLQPYVTYGSPSDKIDNKTAITFTKDTATPVLSAVNFGFASTSEAASTNAKNTSAENNNKLALGTTNIAGGTLRKYVVFEVQATDTASGIGEVTLSVSSNYGPYTLSEDNGHYYTESIDVSSWSETNTLIFTVKDKAGLSVTNTKQFTVDNKAPVATLISPESTDTQTGIVSLSGTANDEYSTVEEVRYLVLNNDYYTDSGINETKVQDDIRTAECSRSGSNNTWKFILNGIEGADGYTNAKLPSTAEELDNYSEVTHKKDIYTMTVYIYAKDALGNESFTKKQISYNPYGDRPTAEVTFPTSTKDSENKVTPANVNGAIRVTGSAQDNVSVKEVYIQLDVNNDGDFTDADKNILADCKDGETPIYQIVTSISGSDMSAIGDNFWGIRVNGTYSWNYTINKFSELLREGNNVGEEKYAVNIRAVAVDNNYKFGNWSEIQYVEFDTNIPSIGVHSKNVKEYADDGTTLLATKAYITDMYLKGKAELELSVEDKEGIEQVMYYIADTEEDLARAKEGIIIKNGEAKTWGSGATETKGYIVKIPLAENSSASGTKYVKVVATKDSDTETTAYEKFSVNFDNSVPVINKITLNGVNYDDSDKKIVNSNGTYFTFGGSVTDEGNSGFDKVLFYYYREGKNGNPNRIYDPMIDSTNSSNKDEGRVNVISGLPSRVLAKQTLYGTEQNVTIASDKRTFTISKDSHIRAGGVVEINGTWLTIEKIEGTKVTLKSDAPVTGSQKVFFAYAQVIDNTGSEKTDASGNVTSASDDGDGMAESIIKSLNTWTYDATFHSNYIPDGPGKLVVFAFDKAGNVSAGSYEASVQNNAPRLTRVMLATDLNDNGTYEYYSDSVDGPINNLSDKATANGTEFGEFAFYSTLNNKGEGSNIATVTLPAGRDAFIVKNNLLVVPEFTGGNGTLSYTYKIADTLDNATITTINEEGIVLKSFTEAESSKIVKKDGSIGDFGSSKTDENSKSKEFEFSYEDLYKHESWTSAGKNTKYLAATFWDSTEETTPGKDSCYALLKMPLIINVIDDTKPKASITPFYWNSKEDSSFVYDEDGNPLGHIDLPAIGSNDNPGVSGQVYIEGTAWDDTRLGGIWIKGPGDSDKFAQLATFENGNWTCESAFEILEDYGITQSGHTVKWRYKMDMTPYGIGTDKVVTVKAEDAMTKANVSDITTSDSKYTMDFVPYIKSIYPASETSANRSRLGKFPVRAGENMIIEGMNFAENSSYTVKFYKTGASGLQEVTDEAISGKISKKGEIKVKAPQYSRWVEVVVDTVATKNNTNVNGGYNIEAGYVAKANDKGLSQANTAGTNFWTDDRYISVWNVGTTFADSTNPIMGTIESIRSTSTTFSVDKQIRSGFASNTLYSLWGGEDNMMWSEVMGVYGEVGSNEKSDSLNNQSSGALRSPPAETDTCVVNNTIFHTFLDDGWADASTMGMGLMIFRDGELYADSEYVEKISKDMYRHQFQNIKLAGAYVDDQYHIYVSYYDAYTKCLKYGKFVYRSDRDQNRSVENRYATRDTDDGKYVVDGVDSTTDTTNKGQYSDIKIDSSSGIPIPVIAYYYKYKGDNGKLRIARGKSTTPQGANSTYWDYIDIDSPSGAKDFGRFVAIEMDNGGNLHITAQDETKGILYYGFFNKTSSGYTISSDGWQKVDSTCAGKWNDIKLENPAGENSTYSMESCKPVITYMNKAKTDTTSAVKVAYYSENGFESITSPSSYAASDEKLSVVVSALDKSKVTNKYAVGFNSDMFAVDFLRGEE